jgi:endonuclease-3
VKVETDLNGLVPPEERGRFSLRLILHGRQVCFARKPACGRCVLVDICPSADPAAKAQLRRERALPVSAAGTE